MRRSIDSSDSTWTIRNPNSVDVDPTIPDLWETPTVDQLMTPDAPTLPWWIPQTPTMPAPNGRDPFGPIPSVPNTNKAPIEVDPPSRPPQWMFGPPRIIEGPPPRAPFPLAALLSPDTGRALSEWSSSSSRRRAPSPTLLSAAPATPLGSVVDLLADYIRRQKQLNAEPRTFAFGTGAPAVPFVQSDGFMASDDNSVDGRSAIRRLSSPLLGITAR